jgi:hypothetical protein
MYRPIMLVASNYDWHIAQYLRECLDGTYYNELGECIKDEGANPAAKTKALCICGIILKNKITSSIINLGYYTSIIKEEISKYDFKVDKESYQREYNKIYKSLSRKYEGNELEYKIKQKLYQKGMYYED